MIARFTSHRSLRLRLRFSLRTLLLVMAVCGAVCGLWVNRAEKQRRAVSAVRAAGGQVLYDFQAAGDEAPFPAWLSKVLPDDYLADAHTVWLPPSAKNEDLRPVGELTKLRRVLLGGTSIGEAGLSHLTALQELEELFLDGYRVKGAGLDSRNIAWSSDSGGMELTNVALAHIARLSSLRVLSLRGTMLSGEGLRSLGALSNLRELNLGYAGIRISGTWEWFDDTEIEYLRELGQLESLDLSHTNVSDASVVQLAKLTKLKWLVLSGKMSQEGYEQLRKSLPSCRVWR